MIKVMDCDFFGDRSDFERYNGEYKSCDLVVGYLFRLGFITRLKISDGEPKLINNPTSK